MMACGQDVEQFCDSSPRQRVRMYRDLVYLDGTPGAVLLVDLKRFDFGQGLEALVANELAEDSIETVEVWGLVKKHEEL